MTTVCGGQTAALVKLKKQTRSTKKWGWGGETQLSQAPSLQANVPFPVARPSQEVLSPRPS